MKSGITPGAALAAAALLLVACSDNPPITLRSRADANVAAPANSNDPVAAQCEQLRDQIRADQQSGREAVAVSTNPQIVAAAQGKADQRIDELRERMDALDCTDQPQRDIPSNLRSPVLPPAPNAPNP
jgi:hypothetical protein